MKIHNLPLKNSSIRNKLRKCYDGVYRSVGGAYSADGNFTALPANTPRIDLIKGILVESSTTNLFPSIQSQSFTGTWTSGTLNGTYTVSIDAGGSLTISGGATGTCASGGTLTFTVSNATVTFTPTGTPTHSQLELKSYSTSWTLGGTTRNYDEIKLPGQLINPSDFTIEIEFWVNSNFNTSNTFCLLEMVLGTKNRLVIQKLSSGAYQLATSNNSGNISIVTSGTTALNIGKHTATLKGTSTILSLFIDGQSVGTPISNPDLPLYRNMIRIGATGYNTDYCSGQPETYITSVSFSKARTDIDIATRGNITKRGFVIDKNTRGYIDFRKCVQQIGAYFTKLYYYSVQKQSILKPSIVSNNPNHYEAWPSIAQLENGTLLCSYRTADTNNHSFEATGAKVLRKSTNGGHTWGNEITIAKIGTNLDNRNGGMLVFDNNGTETILHTFDLYDGPTNDTKIYSINSTDGGNTWSTPILIANTRSTNGNPIKLSNGNIIVSSCSSLVDGHLYIEKSTDNGQTWTEILIANDATNKPNETTIIETKTSGSYTGGVMAIARNLNSSRYSLFKSTDYGATWGSGILKTAWVDTSQTRLSLTRIQSDLIMASYTTYPDGCIAYRISNDEGITWTKPVKIPINGFVSLYPDSILLNDSITIATAWCTNIQPPNEDESSDVYMNFIPKANVI